MLCVALGLIVFSPAHVAAKCLGVPDGAACDDGRACTTGDVCLNEACTGTPDGPVCARGYAFLSCHRARRADRVSAFAPRRSELVLDERRGVDGTGPERLDLKRATVLCWPAWRSDVDVPDGSEARRALEGYGVRIARTRPRQPKLRTQRLTIDTALGAATVLAKGPRHLLVTSGVDVDDGPAPTAVSTRRFVCYGAKRPSRRARRRENLPVLPRTSVELMDIRGGSLPYRLGRPTTVCVPELEIDDVVRPPVHDGYLLCRKAKLAARGGRPSVATVAVTNRFGSERLKVSKVREVCLPGWTGSPPEADEGGGERFPFLDGTSPVDEALRAVWEVGLTAHRTVEGAGRAQTRRRQAIEVLTANAEEAARSLAAALDTLSAGDLYGHQSLAALFDVAGDTPEVHERLAAVLMAVPAQATEDPAATHDVVPGPRAQVRAIAMGALAAHARRGSISARAHLLDALASPYADTRADAVGRCYELSSDRRRAQREMRSRLPASDRHLLYLD